MPRTKKYNELEVIEKAMNLFWQNGYKSTSMQMLEKEMGINKFSIYSSFGSKNGIFLESLKCYRQKLNKILEKLRSSENGVLGIKQFFHDFMEFTKDTELGKGCLVTNTVNEIGKDADEQIKDSLTTFTSEVKLTFTNILKQDKTKDNATIEQQADFLIIAMFGLSSATRIFAKNQLDHYIENIFTNT